MPPQLALILCLAFVGLLFIWQHRTGPRVSSALWIPLLWLFIVGSRPISVWFGFGPADDPLEGSPLDRLVFLVLILAAFAVLLQRRINWNNIAQRNAWLFVFFAYLGVSVAWSDYPFVSFKRWVKDVGNILMVLIVLTDRDPLQAAKTVLTRCCFIVLPLSVVLIKYYPEIGRYYDRWTGRANYCGVTTDKNMLGMTLFACGLTLIWVLLDLRQRKPTWRTRIDYSLYLFLAGVLVWLLLKANSSTALACTVLGAGIFWSLRFPAVRQRVRSLGAWTLAGLSLLLVLHFTLNLGGWFVQLLGRDLTLTGRTEIWNRVLKEDINPLLGEGFYSFWLGSRVDRVSEGYYGGEINEAHNAILETYLNSGFIGVLLLLALLVSCGRRIKYDAMRAEPFSAFRLTCFLVVLVYGMTESVFNRLSIVWFLFLLIVTQMPRRSRSGPVPSQAAQKQAMGVKSFRTSEAGAGPPRPVHASMR